MSPSSDLSALEALDAASSAFESGQRDVWQRPDAVMRALGDLTGARVLDLGAGSGYFTWRLAQAVGATGHVHAGEKDQPHVDWLSARAHARGLANVRAICTAEASLIPPDQDLIFVASTWRHLGDHPAWARGFAQALAPRGRIALIDSDPPSRPTTLSLMSGAGLTLAAEHAILPRQYFLCFGVA